MTDTLLCKRCQSYHAVSVHAQDVCVGCTVFEATNGLRQQVDLLTKERDEALLARDEARALARSEKEEHRLAELRALHRISDLKFALGLDRSMMLSALRSAEKERDDTRSEVARLREALTKVSLDEYESTSSASEKVHGHARIARNALHGASSVETEEK